MDHGIIKLVFIKKEPVLLIILTMLVMNLIIPAGADNMRDKMIDEMDPDGSRLVNISLSGKENVLDVSSTVIHGEEFQPNGGHLGQWVWTGDLNGDGFNDMALAAPMAEGSNEMSNDGKVYIFFGDEDPIPSNIDLTEYSPDMIIIGANTVEHNNYLFLTNEITSGDYNGDGHQDIAIASPESGMDSELFVIWGKPDGFPYQVELFSGCSYPGDTSITGLIGAGQAPGSDDTKVPNYLETADINNDGFDDLISGGYSGSIYRPITGEVFIFKGGEDGFTEPARIQDKVAYSSFGWSLDIGDIDGDGQYDMVVGAPWRDNEGRGLNRAGSAFLFFNITGIEAGEIVDPVDTCRCIINGSGEYDDLGRNVELIDVDEDGFDDIIIGAPRADGIMDFSSSCGQIYMFKGGPELSFPKDMDAETGFHSIVIGPDPYEVEGLDANPECIGEVMEVGDVDGDGTSEFALGSGSRNLEPDHDGMRQRTGAVMLFELEELFPASGGIVKLSHNTPFFTIEGEDMFDSLGFDLEMGDVDNDGIDDILIGAPGGDGPDNSRSSCGEAYLIRGCGLQIRDLTASGKGIIGPDILAGGHSVNMNISFSNTRGSSLIGDSIVHLDPSGRDIYLIIEEDSISKSNDPIDLVRIINADWGYFGERGWLNISISLSWYFPIGDLDIRIEMLYLGDVVSYRDFEKFLHVRSALEISERISVYVSNDLQLFRGQWHRSGSVFTIEDMRIRYSAHRDILVPENSVELVLLDNGTEIDRVKYSGSSSLLEATIDPGRYSNFTIAIFLIGEPPPELKGPSIGDPLDISFNVDDSSPECPNSAVLFSPENDMSGFSSTGEFDLFIDEVIGYTGDDFGSGIREFQFNINGGDWRSIHSEGGLFGTYYSDHIFENAVIERIDGSISFLDWGYWSPDDQLIPPDHFSVRWHGWIEPPEGSTLFRLRGYGQASVVLNGEVSADWGRLERGMEFGPIEYFEDPIPIEIYYIHDEEHGKTEKAGIQLEYKDLDGYWQILESGLEFPSNISLVAGEADLEVGVRSVDWVDLESDVMTIIGRVDKEGPSIDTSSVDRWYSDPEPVMGISIDDGEGAGLNYSSVTMSLLPDGEQWSVPISSTMVSDDNNGAPVILFKHFLGENWRGRVRFEATDLLRNIGRSETLEVGVDMIPPEALLISPDIGDDLTVGETKVVWRLSDGAGSGIDDDSITLRFQSEVIGENWQELDPVDINITGGYVFAEFPLFIPSETVVNLQVRCRDVVGNNLLSSIETIHFEEVEMDLPPNAVISLPLNNSRHNVGELILLDSTGTSDDGIGGFKELHLSWFSSRSGYLGCGESLKIYLDQGEHIISLHADDGTIGHNVSTSVIIVIEERDIRPDIPPEGNPSEDESNDVFFFLLATFVMTILIGFLIIYLLYRKRSAEGESLSIGFRERTQDDDEYKGDEYDDL